MSDTKSTPASEKSPAGSPAPKDATGAPWRSPKALPGTENTPSSNPNYRRVDPPKPSPPPAAPPANRA